MKKILVAINDSTFSDEVVRFACKLAKQEPAEIFFVYVFEVPRSMPLEAEVPEEAAKADKLFERAIAIAENYKLKSETDFIQSRLAGSGILDEAAEVDANLIVIGMATKHRIDEAILGSTVGYILKNSAVRVAVLKEPVQ